MIIPLDPIRKISASRADEILQRVDLSGEAKAFRTVNLSPQGYLALLLSNALFVDAVRFMAFALPVREGVWWATRVGEAIEGASSGVEDACYGAAETWVYEPSDQHRFDCLAAAESVSSSTPGAYAALGAFWSGGSLVPEPMPAVEPDPSLAPIGIAASVLLAVAAGDPMRSQIHFQDALKRAVEIGNGGDGRSVAAQGAR